MLGRKSGCPWRGTRPARPTFDTNSKVGRRPPTASGRVHVLASELIVSVMIDNQATPCPFCSEVLSTMQQECYIYKKR